MTPIPAPARRRRFSPGAVLLAGGLVLVAVAVAVVVGTVGSRLWGGLTGPVYPTPSHISMKLAKAEYAVYELTGSQTGGSGFSITRNNLPTLQPSDVQVTDSAGTVVPTSAVTSMETLNRNGEIFTASVRFTAPHKGAYEIGVVRGGTAVVIAADLGSAFASALPGFLIGVLGALCAVIGTIVLIVSASRRRRQPMMPGWYPHPSQPGAFAFFDGRHWLPGPPPPPPPGWPGPPGGTRSPDRR